MICSTFTDFFWGIEMIHRRPLCTVVMTKEKKKKKKKTFEDDLRYEISGSLFVSSPNRANEVNFET